MRRRSPVYGSLVAKHIWFGVERTYWAFAFVVVAFAVMFLKQPNMSIFALIPLLLGNMLTSNDPDSHKLYMKYKKFGFSYAALRSEFSENNLRPHGYGRE
jgi:Type IV secretory pathway, VirB3-like protein